MRATAEYERELEAPIGLALPDDFAAALDVLEPAGSAETLDGLAAGPAGKLRNAVARPPDEPSDAELHRIHELGKRDARPKAWKQLRKTL